MAPPSAKSVIHFQSGKTLRVLETSEEIYQGVQVNGLALPPPYVTNEKGERIWVHLSCVEWIEPA